MAPGGAIVGYHGVEVILNDIIVANNLSAGYGGGLCFLRPGHLNFTNSVIENNQSQSQSGGGLFVSNESISDTVSRVPGSLSHLTFVNNYAQIGGGGIFIWNTVDFNITHCTFVGNEANETMVLWLARWRFIYTCKCRSKYFELTIL